MVAIPFPKSSAPGRVPQETAGRLVNAYSEALPDGRLVVRRAPGLSRVADAGAVGNYGHCRGFHYVASLSTLLMALDGRLVMVQGAAPPYLVTDLGSLPGSGPVTFAQNNVSPVPNIVCVTDAGCYNVFATAGSAPTSFADPDLPSSNSVAGLDGYLLWTIRDGRIFASDLNAVSINSLGFATFQAVPGGLLRGVSFRREFFAFGQGGTGVYYDAGAQPFPLKLQAVIPNGLAGTYAVAGWEPGWAAELIWVGDNNVVYRLDGYSPVRVSTPPVERAIEALADRSALEASVTMAGGHPFWALTAPGSWTWVFDVSTGEWHERASYGRADWRGAQGVRAFGRSLAGDRVTGKLWEVSAAAQREGDDPLVFEAWSLPVVPFPARLAVPAAYFDFAPGVGNDAGADPVETDPQALVSWSHDGGARFGSPLSRALGSQGATRTRVQVNRTGLTSAAGRVWKVQVSDPVPVSLMGGEMITEGRS